MGEIARLALEVLKSIWGWVVFFSPIKIMVVHDGELGARYTFGKPGKTLRRGMRFATSLQTLSSEQAVGILIAPEEAVDCFTTEGIPLAVFGVVAYDIDDFAAFNRHADAEALLDELLQASLVDVFSRLALREAIASPTPIKASVRAQLQRTATERELGIRVRSAQITGREIRDPAMVRAICLAEISSLVADVDMAGSVAVIAGATPTIATE